ncbi:MAG: hypothetical protein ACLT2T_09745 [Bilophila wadsworthia]
MLGTLFFDKQDRELLRMINETIDHGPSQDLEHKVFDANLHPHGILELTTTHEYRMAHAVINLLGNLEAGGAPDRLMALRILRDEVLHSARTPFRYNTGRVLIQIMKEIIRSRQDELTQLKLVHDFRKVTSGNPRLVRQFLNTYHLLEMPEEWNQLTVDHHVHDANTKGRKNATHLIMDAWIKGIRYITVVYYNYVEPAAARELLQAAEIMGVDVRIGLEFRTPFRDRFVCFVWAPRGFSDPEAFLSFLAERPMVALMNEGRKASLWMQRHVMDTLQLWNAKHAPALAEELEIPVPLLEPEAFLAYVGTQTRSSISPNTRTRRSSSTLSSGSRYCRRKPHRHQRTPEPDRTAYPAWTCSDRSDHGNVAKPERNPELPSPDVPDNAPDTPERQDAPHVLLDWLSACAAGNVSRPARNLRRGRAGTALGLPGHDHPSGAVQPQGMAGRASPAPHRDQRSPDRHQQGQRPAPQTDTAGHDPYAGSLVFRKGQGTLRQIPYHPAQHPFAAGPVQGRTPAYPHRDGLHEPFGRGTAWACHA